ncbi:AAA family ATPase [Aliiroseovarius sp. 2305UL8-7]|uniref:AAA family ATPase n=1 Tax=Aliiroseovarius conchicola TaxID=3121637 RepID=UPI0035282919
MESQIMNCVQCTEPLQPGAKFCAHCGTEVLQDVENPEIRMLTIQFIDLVGSTALADQSELETYDDTIAGFHRLVSDTVTTYRGTILQRYGDGVLACFGLIHDGEDSALSAIASGLSIAKAAPGQLGGQNVRIGIDSGQVMCRVGQSGTLYPQLAGLHVNRAARLQEQAPTGGVVISGETQSLLSRLAQLDCTSATQKLLKGIDQPVEVIGVSGYSFLERHTYGDGLLERDAELSALLAGDAENFALIGPAGIGKSALLSELIRRLAPTPVVQMDARANLQQTALFPIVDVVRRELSLTATSPIDELKSALDRIGFSPETGDLNLLSGVLGLRDFQPVLLPPEQQKARRISLVTDLLRLYAQNARAILAFDDFHWADDETAAVIQNLATDPDFAGRLIVTSRPTDAVSALVAATSAKALTLHPLSDSAAHTALEAFPDLSPARRDEITRAAEGNPLFLLALAEHARQLGNKSDALPLPPNIEATFQAIINNLGPLKEVVQCASVLGRQFDPNHVALLLPDNAGIDDQLRFLTINGTMLKRPDGLAFNHILLRDAAYEMLPGKRRRALHLKFANQLQVHHPDLCAELPELLADHLLAAKAHDQIPAACMAAGIRMLMGANFDPAIKYLDSARLDMEGQTKGDTVDREEHLPILSLLASAHVQRFGFSHPTVLESYRNLETAVDHAEGTDRQRMIALYGLFAHRIISGEVYASGAFVEQMESLAKDGSDELKVLWLVNKTAYELYAGNFEMAAQSSASLKEIYRAEDHGMLFLELGADPLASVLSADVHILIRKNKKEAALSAIDTAKTHLNAIGATAQLPWIHIFGAQAFFEGGHMDIAWAEIQSGIDIADEQRADFWSLIGRIWQMILGALDRDSDVSPEEFEAFIGQASAIGAQLNLPFYNAVLARLLAQRGDLDKAKSLLSQADTLIAERGEREWASRFEKIRAEIHAM